MEIYLTDIASGDIIRFPMLPEEITVQTGAIFQSYSILGIGEIKLPAGEELTGFSWEGTLPGKIKQNEQYVNEWRDPLEIQQIWSGYRQKGNKLRLLVTETPINHDVYLDKYTAKYSGGHGDYDYTIEFLWAKSLKVYVSGASADATGTANTVQNSPQGQERPEPPPAETYTVVKGDTLWAIAQKLLGAGSRYPEIHEANKAVIGSDPNLILPGQVLTIPR